MPLASQQVVSGDQASAVVLGDIRYTMSRGRPAGLRWRERVLRPGDTYILGACEVGLHSVTRATEVPLVTKSVVMETTDLVTFAISPQVKERAEEEEGGGEGEGSCHL